MNTYWYVIISTHCRITKSITMVIQTTKNLTAAGGIQTQEK